MRIIVYHAQCHDGITALWVAMQKWPDAVPYAGRYSSAPRFEDFAGHDVVIVDFSWKLSVMSRLVEVARSLQLIDHHATAQADLAQGASLPEWAVFDMERSGAGLAWDVLIGGDRPPLISYVEDRDLWRFALPSCREVHAACNSYPLTLEARNELMRRSIEDLASEGVAILRYHDKLVESVSRYATTEEIGGYRVPSVACPVIEIVSDLGNVLAEGHPFAAVFADRPDGSRAYSLRSSKTGGLDVGAIAALYGGGGHKHAAGFTRGPANERSRTH